MKKLLLAIIILSFSKSYSQISITIDDLPALGVAYFSNTKTTNFGSIHPGNKGTGLSWDFSNLTSNGRDTNGYFSPVGTPFYMNFPSASHATALETEQGPMYFYFKAEDSQILLIGLGLQSKQLVGNPNIVLRPTPSPLQYLSLPIEYGYAKSSSATFKGQVKYNGGIPLPFTLPIDSIRIEVKVEKFDTVDASGSIKTPLNTYEAIRLKSKMITTNNAYLKTSGTWVDVATFRPTTPEIRESYAWWAKGIGYEVFNITYDSTNISSVAWFDDKVAVGLGKDNVEANSFFHLHPNPTKDVVSINVHFSEKYDVFIYNGRGEMVDNSFSLSGSRKIDMTNFQKGLYFISIKTTNNRLVTQKIVVE